ncbi:MAG: prepilin-type N-terminal cleavage/methylation domain-containing protein [Chthoniobacterales bacterium]
MPRNHANKSKPPNGGFTLVELLVVVAIIATLTAILIPAANGAHRRAQQATCMGNARSVAQAVFGWMADNNGSFTGRAAVGYADPSISINQVNSYMIGVTAGQRGWAGLPRCPLAQTNKAQAGGYSINFNLMGTYPTLSGMPFSASRCILISEDNNAYMYNVAMTMEMTGTMWGIAYDGVNPSTTATYNQLKAKEGMNYTPQYHGDPTNRGLNMIMADGSGALVTSGRNCNFGFAPMHAGVTNGIVGPTGYIFDQMYYITNGLGRTDGWGIAYPTP